MTNSQNSDRVSLVHITTIPLSLVVLINRQITFMQGQWLDVQAISSPGQLADQFVKTYGVPYHAVTMTRAITPVRDLIALYRLWRKLLAIRPQIVHSHTPKAGLLGTLAAWLARVSVRIYQVRGLRYLTTSGFVRRLLMWSERLACLVATQVICNSHSNMQQILDDGLCSPDKIRVLLKGSGNGVDALSTFNPDHLPYDARADIRTQYGIPTDALVVGTVGRIVRDKGMIEMATAWQQLRTQFDNLYWLAVGPFEQGNEIPECVRTMLEQDDRIHLTGYVDKDQMPDLLAAMDVLSFPSYREGFPNVLLEAAAMRIPVVTTNATGCVDAVVDGVTGTLVPVGDAGALADALQTYLLDTDLRQAHGQAGRERVLRDFQQERIWQAIYETYVELLAEKGIQA